MALIVFDCDGVLLDSNEMKSEAFKYALRDYPKGTLSEFINYQKRSFGRSRYRLIDDFEIDYLKKEILPEAKERILADFGAFCADAYLTVPETLAMRDVLGGLSSEFNLAIASGSDEAELNEVFKARGLSQWFCRICGSPRRKADILKQLTVEHEVICMVGDAEADLDAALTADVPFVYMRRYSLVQSKMLNRAREDSFRVIETLSDLPNLLQSGA